MYILSLYPNTFQTDDIGFVSNSGMFISVDAVHNKYDSKN